MKVLLYTENEKMLSKSGLGKAVRHQQKALEDNGMEYTKNPKDDFDIVHINWYGIKSYRLAKWAKKRGKKVVYHAHSTEEDFRNSFKLSNTIAPLFKKWLIKCYSLGDVIITPTPYSKGLLEGYGLKNIKAVSNGIDTGFFVKDEKAGEKFRKKYGYGPGDKVVMAIGLYLERKGILDFVELAKAMPEYKFIWFGYTDLKLVPAKIKRAVNTKLANLKFAGYVEADMIKAALSGADLYIFPTLEETEGIPILEACACRQKALIRDIGVFEGWLKDGINVYKAKNLEGFKTKIRDILEGRVKDLTEEAYKLALKKDTKIVGKQLIEIYKELINC